MEALHDLNKPKYIYFFLLSSMATTILVLCLRLYNMLALSEPKNQTVTILEVNMTEQPKEHM